MPCTNHERTSREGPMAFPVSQLGLPADHEAPPPHAMDFFHLISFPAICTRRIASVIADDEYAPTLTCGESSNDCTKGTASGCNVSFKLDGRRAQNCSVCPICSQKSQRRSVTLKFFLSPTGPISLRTGNLLRRIVPSPDSVVMFCIGCEIANFWFIVSDVIMLFCAFSIDPNSISTFPCSFRFPILLARSCDSDSRSTAVTTTYSAPFPVSVFVSKMTSLAIPPSASNAESTHGGVTVQEDSASIE